MNKEENSHSRRDAWFGIATLTAVVLLGTMMASAQTNPGSNPRSGVDKISAGTILPVVLHTSLSFDKCKAGQPVSGSIAQDVPMANGVKIRKGAAVEGHIVEVSPNAKGNGKQVALQFDKISLNGQWVSMVTNLRAIAASLNVMEAHVPDEAPNEGSPYEWLPTTQIGGDAVYGQKGQVMSADDPSKVVGKSVPNGVLVQASAKEGTKCRGSVGGNDSVQALWVFSSSACGVYGIDNLAIVHAGRSEPLGEIVLAANEGNVELRAGDGFLLRVQ